MSATTQAPLAKQEGPTTLLGAIERTRPQIAASLPKGMDADRFVRIVLTLVQKTPKLAECSPNSILLAIMQAAELGLELGNIMGHAYLVPYKETAQLQIGWRGFIELARRSGEINSISAEVVCERDKFSIQKGDRPRLTHVPALEKRGDPIGAYAVVFYKSGFKDFEWMNVEQIEACRASSKAKDNGPWVTHWEEMARKTPIRRLAKRLPLSANDSALIRAAVIDEYHEAGVEDEAVEPGKIEFQESPKIDAEDFFRGPKHDKESVAYKGKLLVRWGTGEEEGIARVKADTLATFQAIERRMKQLATFLPNAREWMVAKERVHEVSELAEAEQLEWSET